MQQYPRPNQNKWQPSYIDSLARSIDMRGILNLFLSIHRCLAQCPSTDESCISINMRKTNEKTLTHYRMPISAEGLSGRYWIRTSDLRNVSAAL